MYHDFFSFAHVRKLSRFMFRAISRKARLHHTSAFSTLRLGSKSFGIMIKTKVTYPLKKTGVHKPRSKGRIACVNCKAYGEKQYKGKTKAIDCLSVQQQVVSHLLVHLHTHTAKRKYCIGKSASFGQIVDGDDGVRKTNKRKM